MRGCFNRPNSLDTATWKFAVLCDTRGNNDNITGKSRVNDTLIKRRSIAIANMHCDLVLFPGDMINGWLNNGSAVYEGQFNNWKKTMGPVYNFAFAVAI